MNPYRKLRLEKDLSLAEMAQALRVLIHCKQCRAVRGLRPPAPPFPARSSPVEAGSPDPCAKGRWLLALPRSLQAFRAGRPFPAVALRQFFA